MLERDGHILGWQNDPLTEHRAEHIAIPQLLLTGDGRLLHFIGSESGGAVMAIVCELAAEHQI